MACCLFRFLNGVATLAYENESDVCKVQVVVATEIIASLTGHAADITKST
jgi:hypothetical protein